MKKRLLLTACLVLCVAILTGCMMVPLAGLNSMLPSASDYTPQTETSGQAVTQADGTVVISREDYERYQKFDTLLEIMDIVNNVYYQNVDEKVMLEGAAAGLLDAIGDPYTFYYTPQEYAEMWEDDEGEYVGVGIMISGNYSTQICTITRVFEGGPAYNAGVKKGDILYKVEDLYVTADTLTDAVSIMRGVPGTDVTVSFIRNGEEYQVTMTRAAVTVNRIESMMLEGQIGYIYLYEFAGSCAQDFANALKKLVDEGAKGIMIDLRDNGGGWVEDARKIGDLFLDAGTLCYLEDRAGERQYYRTTTDSKEVQLPLVILVNENTASSSEILTGALKDRANAKVVGVQSYGKGIVQVVLGVGKEGAGIQVTEAQYFTPNGNAVHKIGITPDVVVEMPKGGETMFELGDMADIQLKTAYDTMLEMVR
ncbi:MAG: S41 family peptidase [Clostridia bacterium]|nr:S41 family peptidase [Clostridia bacterium]